MASIEFDTPKATPPAFTSLTPQRYVCGECDYDRTGWWFEHQDHYEAHRALAEAQHVTEWALSHSYAGPAGVA